MTTQMLTSYITSISMAVILAIAGASTALASEVTGTLSSDTAGKSLTGGDINGTVSGDTQTDGNLTGTVTGGGSGGGSSSGGSSSGGGSSSSGGSSSNTPSGAVLGESTSNTSTPGFPNAGFAPEEVVTHATVWSTMMTFIKNIVSF